MNKKLLPPMAALLVTASWLAACATSGSASGSHEPTSATAPAVSMAAASMPGKSPPKDGKPVWTVPTEEEISAALDNNKEMINAAKGFSKLKKDGELMFCKRYKPIGSTIPQIQCITTAQLRVQFEDNNKYKNDMRQRSGKCDIAAGCQSGF
jgi:hypothetical protein